MVNGKANPADIVSKHWGYPQIGQLPQAIVGDDKYKPS
jgi:hypothetical protein